MVKMKMIMMIMIIMMMKMMKFMIMMLMALIFTETHSAIMVPARMNTIMIEMIIAKMMRANSVLLLKLLKAFKITYKLKVPSSSRQDVDERALIKLNKIYASIKNVFNQILLNVYAMLCKIKSLLFITNLLIYTIIPSN